MFWDPEIPVMEAGNIPNKNKNPINRIEEANSTSNKLSPFSVLLFICVLF